MEKETIASTAIIIGTTMTTAIQHQEASWCFFLPLNHNLLRCRAMHARPRFLKSKLLSSHVWLLTATQSLLKCPFLLSTEGSGKRWRGAVLNFNIRIWMSLCNLYIVDQKKHYSYISNNPGNQVQKIVKNYVKMWNATKRCNKWEFNIYLLKNKQEMSKLLSIYEKWKIKFNKLESIQDSVKMNFCNILFIIIIYDII